MDSNMTKKIIHVNRQNISMNVKDGADRPVYTIKANGKTTYAREVEILGPSKLIYNGSQLSCGARAWIETEADLVLTDAMTFAESRSEQCKSVRTVSTTNLKSAS